MADAIAAYRAGGDSFPHFTLDPRNGRLAAAHPRWTRRRGRSSTRAARCETNKAHAIQVELVGFAARDTPDWDEGDYARIARLAREIESAAGVPRRSLATFRAKTVVHLSPQRGCNGAGHCGHQHVPGNNHHDPGALRIDRII